MHKSLYRALVFIIFIFTNNLWASTFIIEDEKAFKFSLPEGWSQLSVRENVRQIEFGKNYFNQNDDVIQLSVTSLLSDETFNRFKKSLKEKHGSPTEGWTLIESEIVEITPFGKVDKELTITIEKDLTSVGYVVYGKNRVAIFTFTFNEYNLEADKKARKLLELFAWKK